MRYSKSRRTRAIAWRGRQALDWEAFGRVISLLGQPLRAHYRLHPTLAELVRDLVEPLLFFFDFGIEIDVDRVFDAHRRRAFHHMCVQGALRPVTHSLGDLQVVLHPNPSDADDTVDIFDVAFDLAPDLIWMRWNLANCQGP